MNSPEFDNPSVWTNMHARLMRLTPDQLRKLAMEEGVPLEDATPKESMVSAIVDMRRGRILERNRGESYHSWRKWNSLNIMPIKHFVPWY